MNLFKPDLITKRITDITPETIKNMGIDGIMVDVDNTLSTHGGQKPLKGLGEWIGGIKNSGIKIIILSNAKFKRVKPFAARIGLPFIHLGAKPLPIGYIRAAHAMELKRKNTAVIGDQIFTDILGARLSGVKAILVRPILPEDKRSFKIRRKYEKKILAKLGYKEDE